jgi:DNA polymerase-3 subunit epsilon
LNLLNTPLNQAPLAVFDLETTGINPLTGHRVIEIGILTSDGLKVEERYETLVNPGRPIPPQASEVNNIFDDMVEDAPAFAQLLPKVDSLFRNRALVAHNASFDIGFLAVEYHLARGKFSPGPILDTVKMARKQHDFPDNKLATICECLGIENSDAHRALADVEATFAVFRQFAQKLGRDREPTVQDWINAQGGELAAPDDFHHNLPADTPLAIAIEKALALRIGYCDKNGFETERIVEPLLCNGDFLVAHCQLRNEQRTFRLDRIEWMETLS